MKHLLINYQKKILWNYLNNNNDDNNDDNNIDNTNTKITDVFKTSVIYHLYV